MMRVSQYDAPFVRRIHEPSIPQYRRSFRQRVVGTVSTSALVRTLLLENAAHKA
jgi:hypothetical protein